MKKVFKEILKFVITVLLFYFLFRMIPVSKVAVNFKNSRIELLIVSFILFFIYYFFFSLRWWYLLRNTGIELGFFQVYGHIILSFFMNNFLPSAVGQDAVRSAYAGGKDRFSICLGVAIIDRLAGFIGMLILGIFALLSSIEGIKLLSLIYLFLVLLLLGAYILLTLKGRYRWLKEKLLSIKVFNIGKEIKAFYDGFRHFRDKPLVLLNGIFISTIVQIFITLINYTIALAMGIKISFYSLLVLLPIITVVSLIPLTVSGLGLREMSYVYLFGLVGIKGEAALSLSLMFYVISVFASIPGGILFLFLRHEK